jgi:hypothetical protein
MHSIRRPWPYVVGSALALLGLALASSSQLLDSLPLGVTMAALVVSALIEAASGESLRRHGGAGMAHLFSGLLVGGFFGFLGIVLLFEPRALTAAPVALMFGLLCAANAVFRAMDLAIDRPRAMLSEALDVAATLALAVVLLLGWREATPSLLGLAGGLDLLVGGVALVGSARAMWRHPELAAYAR